jgi:hypothetical protein
MSPFNFNLHPSVQTPRARTSRKRRTRALSTDTRINKERQQEESKRMENAEKTPNKKESKTPM